MRNLLLAISFDGSRYHGFQVQQNALSVCEVFQDAVEATLGRRWDVKGCSRTDAGVHANDYCISMKLDHTIPCEGFLRALNVALPYDIAVKDVREVTETFHARYSCVGKRYLYRIHNSSTKDPFRPSQVYRYHRYIDAELLNVQAYDFTGRHDFSAFSAARDIDAVRQINSFSVTRKGDEILFAVEGDGFLYHMVRIMVGTLLWINEGRLPPGCVPDILVSQNRGNAGKTAPASGLYLDKVYYHLSGREPPDDRLKDRDGVIP